MKHERSDTFLAPATRALPIVLFILAACLSVPIGASVLDHRGDTSFYSPEKRPFASFPTLESIVPMPLNINPFNRQRVRESCVIHTIRRRSPARGVKGILSSKLLVLDSASGAYREIELAIGRFKTDRGGQASITFDVRTDLFAEGFKEGEIAAWSHTAVKFSKRKGTFALLRCEITANK